MRTITMILAALPLLLFIGCTGTRPPNLGVKDGKLAPCPASPNCVSSQGADDQHAIKPLMYSGAAAVAMKQLSQLVRDIPRAKIITETETYLYAEFSSLIFRFVDDVEFALDERSNLIHLRSASRLGRSDLGVNRKRIEKIREVWNRAK